MPNGRCNLYVCASPKTGADTELTKEEEAEPRGLDSHNTLGLGQSQRVEASSAACRNPPEPGSLQGGSASSRNAGAN